MTDDAQVLALALEYRRVANSCLSHHEVAGPGDIDLGPLPEVADMLRADKIQNYGDFLRFHAATHPRAAALDRYFKIWLERLEVSSERFTAWSAALRELDVT